jgi:acyl-lipid omega-6 desaturase (Delta-12 desaturase)
LNVVARYREPSTRKSLFELFATLVPVIALWLMAWMALSISGWLDIAHPARSPQDRNPDFSKFSCP